MSVSHGELIAQTINADPDFRAEWERLVPARKLANEIIRFRADNGLSQRALAERLKVSQPRVAKLEAAEHNPDFETIERVVRVTGIEFAFDFVPEGHVSKLMSKRGREQQAAASPGVSVIAASA